jgi:hypothetical protein
MNFKNTYSGILNSLTGFFAARGEKGLQLKPEGENTSGNYLTYTQIKKLNESLAYNYEKMSAFREITHEMKEQFMSHLISDAEKKVVLNKIQDAVRIWLQNMSAGDIQINIDSQYPQLRAFGANFERAVNNHLEEIDISTPLTAGLSEALFGLGVYKTGLGAGAPEVFEADGELIDPGRPFTDVINIDDFVIDMSARSLDKVDFIGDRYLRPRAWVKEMIKKAHSEDEGGTTDDRMESRNMPEANLAGIQDGDDDAKIYDNVWVWDLYLPKENKIVTIADGSETPIAVWDWDGPEGGPYDVLGWLYTSGYPLPIPPIANIYELHMFLNEMARKTGRQANNQKSIILIEQGNEKTAEAIKNNNDQAIAMVPAGSLEKMKEAKYGGADPMSMQSLLWAGQNIDIEAGNLTTLGGTGPSAETFRGDALIHENASALIKFLQLGFLKVTRKVLKKHCWWVWTEDIRGFSGEVTIPGTDVSVPWAFTPEEREGNFLDYNFRIDPNSVIGKTPSEKAQEMLQLLNGLVLPNAELFMQAGFMPNLAESLKYICKQMNVPFDILLQAMDPAMQEQMMQGQGATDAPPRMKTSHTINERVSRPGTTPQGNENVMMASLGKMASMGGGN